MNTANTTQFQTLIIGGGAAGLMLASLLGKKHGAVAVIEKGERVGRKLSATGNGQGNITNADATKERYFSSSALGAERASAIVRAYDNAALQAHFEGLGLPIFYDSVGRAYPTGRQASALTDALRYGLVSAGVETFTKTRVTGLEKRGDTFIVRAETEDGAFTVTAKNVVLCTGGKAAKNFGTDGSAYDLAKGLGHTVTALCPSLVQLKTDTRAIRTLKGIRVFDTRITATWNENGTRRSKTLVGDVLFTDYGVSGDGIFRISAFVADKIEQGVTLTFDFLPDFTAERVEETIENKRRAFPAIERTEWLCGIVNNQLGRAIMKTVKGDTPKDAARAIKTFTLAVVGTLGFDYAQVTKGGVPIEEVDEDLQSKYAKGLYFAGEILDVDGQCGGYNLQWAYSSACTVAAAIAKDGQK